MGYVQFEAFAPRPVKIVRERQQRYVLLNSVKAKKSKMKPTWTRHDKLKSIGKSRSRCKPRLPIGKSYAATNTNTGHAKGF